MERRWIGVILVLGLAMVRMTMQCDRHRRQQDAIDRIKTLPAFNYNYNAESERRLRELEALRQGAEAETPTAEASGESITYDVVVAGRHYEWREGSSNEPVVIAPPNGGDNIELHVARTPTWRYQDRNVAFDYASNLTLSTNGDEITLKTIGGPSLVLGIVDGSKQATLDMYRKSLESRSFQCTPATLAVGTTEVAGIRCNAFAARVWTNVAATTIGTKTIGWVITQASKLDENSDEYTALTAVLGSLRKKSAGPSPQFEVRIGDSDVPVKAFMGKPFVVASNGIKFSARIEPRPTIRSTIAGRTFERAAQLTVAQAKTVPVMIMLQDSITGLQYTEAPSGVAAGPTFFKSVARSDETPTPITRQFSSRERRGSTLAGAGPLTGFTLEFFSIPRIDGKQCLISLQYFTEARKEYEANFPKYAATIDSLLGEFTP